MKRISEMITGDLIISENTEITGLVKGTVSVCENVDLNLSGMIVGKLVLKERSRANLYGMLNGDIDNYSGIVDVYGIINGNIINYEKGTCSVGINAKVAGVVSNP